MKRGTIFLVIFVVIVIALIAASQFIGSQPPIEITIAVSPLAEDWIDASVSAFNDADQRINGTQRVRVNYIVVDDLEVWSRSGTTDWAADDHPDGWLPALSASLDYAGSSNIPFITVADSTAATLLVWGGYADRVETLTGGTPLDWPDVQRAAATESWVVLGGPENWRFVNLAFALPDQSASGFGVLLSGAGAFNETTNITSNANSGDFRAWLEPVIQSVPNFNTIGADVARFVARGPSSADIGIAPESQWVGNLNGLLSSGEIRFSYPAYPFVFDFPLAAWNGPNTPQERQDAVALFGDWLRQSAQQEAASAYGLRAADGSLPAGAGLFTAAEAYGIQIVIDLSARVQPPNVNTANGLIQWFNSAR